MERTAKTLIRLGGCPGWSESMMAHSHIVGFVKYEMIKIPPKWMPSELTYSFRHQNFQRLSRNPMHLGANIIHNQLTSKRLKHRQIVRWCANELYIFRFKTSLLSTLDILIHWNTKCIGCIGEIDGNLTKLVTLLYAIFMIGSGV